jgi:hypothetical protein
VAQKVLSNFYTKSAGVVEKLIICHMLIAPEPRAERRIIDQSGKCATAVASCTKNAYRIRCDLRFVGRMFGWRDAQKSAYS